ncbi:flagellar basal body-associated FliL family protein [Puniceibacterium sp. IMCC21224]|uniref:flagellar basal body-associated FliL family protein n=1 Tax=Puniceibacterium sp. IMCC21224 TaxID=1618204 RepID=UPI00064D848B|nr:flagellar basal body-associated FliL family protein [Puniceibacterium sp. IMCC21224]KMK68851.1 Flagellar basal body-associated protein FliL [Puniceibacterium sp. IMCC21224]
MTDATVQRAEPPQTSRKLPMIIGLALALAGGGGGFYAVSSGLIFGSGNSHALSTSADHAEESAPVDDVTFVSLPQLIVSLGPGAHSEHLIFRADLEVPSRHASEVEGILPRVVDVLNSYLRALENRDIEAPGALIKLRSQMLRRVQLVTGPERVEDLLVMEFVLN